MLGRLIDRKGEEYQIAPLISVIIPIYNVEKYLNRCIDSVINQTYENLEIILINDGSPDLCGKICDEYSKTDQRIKVIHKENGGVSSARNVGLKAAKGDYIAFVDPDDYVTRNMFEKLNHYREESQADIVSCCALVENDEGVIKNSFFKITNDSIVVDKQRAIIQLVWNNYLAESDRYIDIGVPWGKLYRKSMLTDNNIEFKESLRRQQDNIFNLYAFHNANKIVYIDDPLYNYNYTNISNVFSKYVRDIDVLFTELTNETNHFLKEYGWFRNNEIQLAFSAKGTSYLISILALKFFNKDYKVSSRDRINSVKRLVSSEPYKSSLSNVELHFFKIHNRLLVKLLRTKHYLLAYILFKTSAYAKRLLSNQYS
ncbi:MAG TPA: glycosyltransferase [Ureibacillus sp.]|nr:glycosyltransferase [Ureibacillus sp.]